MAYLCVDKRGEHIADDCPERCVNERKGWQDMYWDNYTLIHLPNGTIKKLIGKEMTWEDDPICLEEFIYHNGDM